MKRLGLVFTLALVFLLSSCSPKAIETPLGEIEDIETKTYEFDEKNIFTPIENALGYDMRVQKAERAYMSFNIPVNWRVEYLSGRVLRIIAPKDDLYLPGMNIIVSFNYVEFKENPYMNETAFDDRDLFHQEQLGYPYLIDKESHYLRDLPMPDKAIDDPKFANDNFGIVSMQEIDKISLYSKSLHESPKNNYSMNNYYVRWHKLSSLFSGVFKEEQKEKADALMKYIISTIQYETHTSDSSISQDINGCTLTIPSGMEYVGGTTFRGKDSPNNSLSGMTVSVFKNDLSKKEKLDENNMANYIRKVLPTATGLGGYDFMPSAYPDDKGYSISGKVAKLFKGTSAYRDTKEDHKTAAVSLYGISGNLYYGALLFDSETEQTIILYTYLETQQDMVPQLESMLLGATI